MVFGSRNNQNQLKIRSKSRILGQKHRFWDLLSQIWAETRKMALFGILGPRPPVPTPGIAILGLFSFTLADLFLTFLTFQGFQKFFRNLPRISGILGFQWQFGCPEDILAPENGTFGSNFGDLEPDFP